MTLPLFPKRTRILYLALLTVLNLQNSFAKNPVCTTVECRTLGNLYINNLKSSVNPCVNFYKYACSGWEEKYAKSFDKSYWDSEEDIGENVYRMLKDTLESNTVPRDKEFKQAKALYRVCMNTPFLEYSDGRTIMSIAANVAPWPIMQPKNNQPRLIHPFRIYLRHYLAVSGESAFFNLKILADENDYSKYVTEVRRPVTPFGVLFRIRDWNLQEWVQYLTYLDEVIKEVATKYSLISKDVLMTQITELKKFRDELRDICRKSLPVTFVRMTIREFQDWYNIQAGSRRNTAIEWLDLIRVLYKSDKPGNPQVTSNSIVKIHKVYFTELTNLLAKTDIRVLVNHMHFYFAERHVKFTKEMRNALKGTFTDGVNPTGKLVHEHRKWKVCIENHNMRDVLGEMYVTDHFPPEKVTDVSNLMEEAKDLLVHQISNSNWLNNLTKSESVDKAKSIKGIIAASKISGKTAMQPGGVVIHPTNVEIFYNLGLNRIFVTAANLQSPIYGQTFPYPVMYGATMTSFGHELYHAFDQDGIKFTKNGKQPWWPKTALLEYSNQLTCIKDHYDGYRNIEFKMRGVSPTKDTPSTTDEDFADLMGIKLAYIGYKKLLEKKGKVCTTLPGFENYSCDKMFFLAFANTYCTHATPNMKIKSLLYDDHNLPEIRVNAAVANMRQFSGAFNCNVKDPLRTKKPCDIWKK